MRPVPRHVNDVILVRPNHPLVVLHVMYVVQVRRPQRRVYPPAWIVHRAHSTMHLEVRTVRNVVQVRSSHYQDRWDVNYVSLAISNSTLDRHHVSHVPLDTVHRSMAHCHVTHAIEDTCNHTLGRRDVSHVLLERHRI